MKDKKTINIWELWEKEWKNAKRFFDSKGNIRTKSKYKDKWFKDFSDIIQDSALKASSHRKEAIKKMIEGKRSKIDRSKRQDCYGRAVEDHSYNQALTDILKEI